LSTTADSLIVVENGKTSVADGSSIVASHIAFVPTGSSTTQHTVDFPKGYGQSASLAITPPALTTNPWRAVAIYQNPALTTNVDITWGPGSTLTADGLLYLPKSNCKTPMLPPTRRPAIARPFATLDGLITATANGLRFTGLQARLDALEHEKADLERRLSARERVVVLPRQGGGVEVELVGEIAAIVAAAQSSAGAGQQKAAPGGAALGPDVVRSVKVVAGTRIHRELRLPCLFSSPSRCDPLGSACARSPFALQFSTLRNHVGVRPGVGSADIAPPDDGPDR
jgi:hypothetical protein